MFKVDQFIKGKIVVFNFLPYLNIGKSCGCKFINIGWLFWNLQIKK